MNQPAPDHPRPGNDTNPTAGPKPSQDPSTRPRTPSTAHAAPLAGSDPEWLDSYILKRVDYHVRAIRRQYQRNEADSEDVAQMLLLKINRARAKFDPSLAS